jgi:hypothetical protein
VHGLLDGTTLSKYRRTVLNKTFLVMMTGLFSFVSSKANTPPPDVGNANGNTAEGTQALFSNTTGKANTAIGVGALYQNTTGVSNTATGMAALGSNTTGFSNTAIGAMALLNATGNYNVALGNSAGQFLSTGDNNIDGARLGRCGFLPKSGSRDGSVFSPNPVELGLRLSCGFQRVLDLDCRRSSRREAVRCASR